MVLLMADVETTNVNAKPDTVCGVVVESLPNAMFRAELPNGEIQLAYLAGRMRFNRIRVLVGDKVEILLDRYGGKGRIVKRL